jgi:predicted DNA-binding transcriptional regulator AlpA
MSIEMKLPANIERNRVLNSKQVAEIFGYSPHHFLQLCKDRGNSLPKPIKIGARKYGWRVGDIEDYLASRTAAE